MASYTDEIKTMISNKDLKGTIELLTENGLYVQFSQEEKEIINNFILIGAEAVESDSETYKSLHEKVIYNWQNLSEKQMLYFMEFSAANLEQYINTVYEPIKEAQKVARGYFEKFGMKTYVDFILNEKNLNLRYDLLDSLEMQRVKEKGYYVTIEPTDKPEQAFKIVTGILTEITLFDDFTCLEIKSINNKIDKLLDKLTGSITLLSEEEQEKLIRKFYKTIENSHEEKEKEKRQPLPDALTLNNILPENVIFGNHKTINQLPNLAEIGDLEDETINIKVPGKNKNDPEIITKCKLIYGNIEKNIRSNKPFGPYDRSVFDAVVSLYVQGNNLITATTVYRAMTNATDTQYVSPQCKGAVTKSLDKMRHIDVIIDGSEELKARGKDYTVQYEGYLLPLEVVRVKAGGKTEKAYRVLSEPCLYSYSQAFNQVLTVDAKILDIYENKNGIVSKANNNGNRIVIKSYLIRQIEYMKSGRNSIISLDTLYKETIDKATEKQKRSTREYAELCLKTWIKADYIKDYEMIRTGKAFTGIKIYT